MPRKHIDFSLYYFDTVQLISKYADRQIWFQIHLDGMGSASLVSTLLHRANELVITLDTLVIWRLNNRILSSYYNPWAV